MCGQPSAKVPMHAESGKRGQMPRTVFSWLLAFSALGLREQTGGEGRGRGKGSSEGKIDGEERASEAENYLSTQRKKASILVLNRY